MHTFDQASRAQVDAAEYLRRRIGDRMQLAGSAATSDEAALHLALAHEYRDRLNALLDAGRPADIVDS